MVGMPYPNPTDPELRERMAFMDAAAAACQHGSGNGGAQPAAGCGDASPGQQWYQDLCMKVRMNVTRCGAPAATLMGSVPRQNICNCKRMCALSSPTAHEINQFCHSKSTEPDLACAQAVNQCIGRCIRHAGDHAAIVLADVRYAPGGRADAGPCRSVFFACLPPGGCSSAGLPATGISRAASASRRNADQHAGLGTLRQLDVECVRQCLRERCATPPAGSCPAGCESRWWRRRALATHTRAWCDSSGAWRRRQRRCSRPKLCCRTALVCKVVTARPPEPRP